MAKFTNWQETEAQRAAMRLHIWLNAQDAAAPRCAGINVTPQLCRATRGLDAAGAKFAEARCSTEDVALQAETILVGSGYQLGRGVETPGGARLYVCACEVATPQAA